MSELKYEYYGYVAVVMLAALLGAVLSFESKPLCGLYGAPRCQFVPAPPGQTPRCARPGSTYCEHADNYPTHLIKHILEKSAPVTQNWIIDEIPEDFDSYTTPAFYDGPAILSGVQKQPKFNGYTYNTPQQALVHTPAPAQTSSGYYYYGSTSSKQQAFHHYHHHQKSTAAQGHLYYSSSGSGSVYGKSATTPYNATLWLQRLTRDTHHRPRRQTDRAPHTHERHKRQYLTRTTLCETRSMFITPQAALSTSGNWMFVVNAPPTRQQVKAELCASNTCSGLCQLPDGYNSRCEQKFVQKRLIALQASGQNLYTDTFWFPSCCVCTIAAN